jgi:hypothetical protein
VYLVLGGNMRKNCRTNHVHVEIAEDVDSTVASFHAGLEALSLETHHALHIRELLESFKAIEEMTRRSLRSCGRDWEGNHNPALDRYVEELKEMLETSKQTAESYTYFLNELLTKIPGLVNKAP